MADFSKMNTSNGQHNFNSLYAKDKPKDCSKWFFWKNKRAGCKLGKENCYYLLAPLPRPTSKCDGCPYAKDNACVGSCLKHLQPEIWG